jgi:hypothetical protein
MSLLSWSVSAFTACVMAWTAAQPSPRITAPVRPVGGSEDTLLARVEREVTPTLRARHVDRWRYSRVHRPTPTYRVTTDDERSTSTHAAFRILSTIRYGQTEIVAHLVRVDRASGAIEIAPGTLAPGTEPVFTPFVAQLLPTDLGIPDEDR